MYIYVRTPFKANAQGHSDPRSASEKLVQHSAGLARASSSAARSRDAPTDVARAPPPTFCQGMRDAGGLRRADYSNSGRSERGISAARKTNPPLQGDPAPERAKQPGKDICK